MRGIFIDLETGGLDPRAHALLSLGAVAFEVDAQGAWVLDEFAVSVEPNKNMGVCEGALAVQGISWANLEHSSRVEECEALIRFGQWVADFSGFPLFAHNAPFDRDFFTAAVNRSAPGNEILRPLCGHRANWCCTLAWANLLVALGKMDRPEKGFSLESLAAHLDVQGRSGARHDALEDAKIGVRCVGRMAGR